MDFEEGDYIVNINAMKAHFFDELWRMYNEEDNEDVLDNLVVFASVILHIESEGSEVKS